MRSAALVLAFALGVSGDGGAHGGHSHRAGRQGALDSYSAGGADLEGAASDASADPLSMLQSAIPGVPGEDYPIYAEAPETAFVCDGQVNGGYYADPEAECQVFHICTAADTEGGLSKYSFLCPNGTIFNQNYFICDWWFNFDCSEAEGLYSKNDEIAAERSAIDAAASDAAASNAEASYAAPSQDVAASLDDAPTYDSGRAGRARSGRAGRRRSG